MALLVGLILLVFSIRGCGSHVVLVLIAPIPLVVPAVHIVHPSP